MLKQEENELISRVGPGTPMGNFMREYWLPAMLSSELPGPDSDPVRVLLLGEKLIAFRDTNGKVGLMDHACPHRGASLFFGRNEECGLRCVYHGWKFDADGNCVDMPNEPAESDFKAKVKAAAYPSQERGGVVWAYMGPRSTPPPLPDLEGNMRRQLARAVRAVPARGQLAADPRGRHRHVPCRVPALRRTASPRTSRQAVSPSISSGRSPSISR